MSDLIKGDEFLSEEFDLDQLLNDAEFLNDINSLDGSSGQLSDPQQKFAEIEQVLMNDDFDHDNGNELLFEVLLDSPDGSRGEVFDGKLSSPENNKESDAGDPITKKRKRQERNRDAAVKSRERKKLYVKDLEMKSRYFEGECKRLGMMLNCVIAENQALRLSLQTSKAFDASMTKQESAVLLLESLLLGSLLWFLGTMCLLIQPEPLRSRKEVVLRENVDNQDRGSLAPRKAGREIVEHGGHQFFILGRSCKASRSRMRTSYFALEVLA